MGWLGLAFGAFFFLGLANLAMRIASGQGLAPASVLFWVTIGQLPAATFYFWLKEHPSGATTARAWSLTAGVFTAVALVFLNESFTRPGSRAGVAVAIMSANFVLVAVAAFVLFRESLGPVRLAGLAATLVGMWLMARG
jgi:multidrug transporter EmrE-like cation transporter